MSDEKPVRTYQLDPDKIETIEDVRKVLGAVKLRIDTDHYMFDELTEYFTTEVVPRGYIPLLNMVGDEKVAKMTFEQMEEKIIELKIKVDDD
jgi:hypothetical protein